MDTDTGRFLLLKIKPPYRTTTQKCNKRRMVFAHEKSPNIVGGGWSSLARTWQSIFPFLPNRLCAHLRFQLSELSKAQELCPALGIYKNMDGERGEGVKKYGTAAGGQGMGTDSWSK